MQAAEARRRQKVELQAQLDLLNAQEDEERQYQLEQHRAYQTQPTAGPSWNASSSRPDVVSPTWLESQPYSQSQRNQWDSHGNEGRGNVRQRNGQSSLPAFRTMPDPVPMITPSTASTSAPWQRNGSSSSNGQPRQATAAYTPPIPEPSSNTPMMPNPLTSSFINLPVPSKHQTHEYLINRQKQPLGLEMGWSIEGHIFDVYDLFVAVVRLGGSATVTRRQWWAPLAGLLGIPSINTPHGLRASPEAARQLFAFFTLHLGPLEKMWDETRSTESFPKGPALSHDRSSATRIPVSSTRGEEEETRSTYPPPPPQHRESSSNQYNRNQYQSSAPQQPTHPTSMPLHVNPSASSSSFALQQPPQRQNQAKQQSSNGANGLSFTRGEGSMSGPALSVSPVLHQPVPARLDAASTSRSYEQTTIDPRLTSLQSSSSAQISDNQPSSNSTQPASSSKTFTFAPLANYNPPKFASFDHLVGTNALTLPKLPANVNLNLTGTEAEIYAKRCFELRGVVRKLQNKEPARQVSKEEMTFWQKLLAILRHNPQVVIPGSQPMSEANVPRVPSHPIQPATAGADSLTQATAGPSTGGIEAPNGTQQPKKKRGRPSNQDKLDRELAASIAPQLESASATGSPLGKKKRGPRGPYKKKSVAADEVPDSTASASASAPVPAPEPAPALPSNANPDTTTISDAEVAIRHAEAAITHTETDTTSAVAGEGSGSQSRKPRKPYTIRVGPDGTPLSERFKKRLVTGNLGSVEVVRSPPYRGEPQGGDPGPSTLHAFVDPELDAQGELDPDMAQFEGPGGLAAFDAAVGYRGDADPATLSQMAGSSTGPGTNGHDPNAPKVKNPNRVEASKQRWEKFRAERAAERAERGESASAAPGSAGPPRKRGGFSVPEAAMKAATKRWSLQHAALAAPSDESSSSTSVFTVTPIRPMVIASPKRLISLSNGGPSQHEREVTPNQESLRHRAGSLKPRSSLPLRLTPAPRRDWSPVPSQEPEPEMGYDGGNEPADVQWMPVEVTPAKDKGKGVAKQMRAPRSSLPAHLGAMGPPLSTERLKARADEGKGVDCRNPATPEPPRQTRRKRAAVPEVSIRASRHSLPSASTLERVSTRASSVALSQPITRERASVASASPAPQRRASSSQPRIRLIPEIEIITPRRYVRLSPVRPASLPAERSKIKVEPKAQPARVAQKVQPKAKPQVRVKTKPRPRRVPSKYARVVIPIRRRRRADLIAQGHYDPFRDDDSEAEEERRNKRYGHSGLRPKVPLPRGSQARTARPMAPEVVPARFVARAGDEMDERYRSVLAEETILKRTCERECVWKGCDATLASEWHLARHVAFRQHAAQGIFKAGIYGETMLYRCHWEECEQPCFASLGDLEQHLTARHISRVLTCPYPDCGLGYSTLSHLTRHVTKHHDSPSDLPVPLADLSDRIPPPPFPDPPQLLPETARTDILITPPILGSTYPSLAKREACRLLVLKNSFAPEEPILHVEHPPHILQPLEEEVEVEDTVSEAGSYYTVLEGGLVTKERVLDEEYGRPKRRLFPVVDIRVKKRSKVGTAEEIVYPDFEDNDLDGEGGDQEMQASSAPDLEANDVEGEGGGQEMQASSAELPIHNHDTNTTSGTHDRPASDDHQIAELTDLAPVEPTPLLTPLEDVPMDLGEPTEFEDPLDDGTPYSPVVGPRPDDILFDLSDDDDEGEDADQTQRSESEVWAELEDQEMAQAYTPAGMLGDYELSDDEEDDTPDPAGNAEAEAETVTDAIRAAILQPQSGDESATRSDDAPRVDEDGEEEDIRIAGPVLEDISEVTLDGVATERLTNTLEVEVEMDREGPECH